VQAKNAEVESRRTDALMKQGVATQDEYDKARTALEALQAAIRADDAALENARLKLEYCSIKSPIDGRVGSLFIDQGNLIKANDVKIVTINRIRPIYVTFTAPQQELPSIRERMAAGKLDVTAIVPKESQRPERGELTFIDNEVDTATGTIRLKATFANEAERLWPGQFVNVVLTLATEKDAIVAPSEAVQTGQQGQFVFVVKDDLTVEDRPVVVGRALDGETVIQKGLSPGQRVVTDGQLRLVPGAKVAVKAGLVAAEPAGARQEEGVRNLVPEAAPAPGVKAAEKP
jgi:multidrug efflux system membrane fusion protein